MVVEEKNTPGAHHLAEVKDGSWKKHHLVEVNDENWKTPHQVHITLLSEALTGSEKAKNGKARLENPFLYTSTSMCL